MKNGRRIGKFRAMGVEYGLRREVEWPPLFCHYTVLLCDYPRIAVGLRYRFRAAWGVGKRAIGRFDWTAGTRGNENRMDATLSTLAGAGNAAPACADTLEAHTISP